MIALTVCQPYAHLIMLGFKRVENRTWSTKHRGRLMMHAGKSRGWLDVGKDEAGQDVDRAYQIPLARMAFGAVIGEVQLLDCLHVSEIRAGKHDAAYPWLKGHEHVEGPWCWVLGDKPIACTPVPWTGARGLFDIDASKLNAVANFQLGIRESHP